MYLGQKTIRNSLVEKTNALMAVEYARPELKEAAQGWLDTLEDGKANGPATDKYVAALEEAIEPGCTCEACTLAGEILEKKQYLSKKSVWISAATAGRMTSASAAWTMSWLPARTST